MSNVNARPLYQKRILVTRTRDQASALCQRLLSLGAIPIEFPTIKIVPPTDWSNIDAALTRLWSDGAERYNWLVLTSVNGVHIFCQRAQVLGYDWRLLQRDPYRVKIATIGPATAAALREYDIIADLVPDTYVAEGVAEALFEKTRTDGSTLEGQRFLLPRAAEARKVLTDLLQEAGAIVDDVATYYTQAVTPDDEHGREILRLLLDGDLDYLTFTSSSTVRNFMVWLKGCEEREGYPILDQLLKCTHIASIGPITSQTARDLHLRVDVEATEFTIDGLIQAILYREETSW